MPRLARRSFPEWTEDQTGGLAVCCESGASLGGCNGDTSDARASVASEKIVAFCEKKNLRCGYGGGYGAACSI
jgi:hypothetical protein